MPNHAAKQDVFLISASEHQSPVLAPFSFSSIDWTTEQPNDRQQAAPWVGQLLLISATSIIINIVCLSHAATALALTTAMTSVSAFTLPKYAAMTTKKASSPLFFSKYLDSLGNQNQHASYEPVNGEAPSYGNVAIMEPLPPHPPIVVGSGMGGWVLLLVQYGWMDRLRWRFDTYMDYLRDTPWLARQHADSLLQQVYSPGFTVAEVCHALIPTSA